MSRLGALREFDLDHLDLRLARHCRKVVRVERPIFIAATEIAAADLPNDVAAKLAVIRAQPALAGIVREAAHLGALVERTDGIGAARAEAHGGSSESE